jgi:hypothetical protein
MHKEPFLEIQKLWLLMIGLALKVTFLRSLGVGTEEHIFSVESFATF